VRGIKVEKMNWKEFFKPDWRKILIFLVLFILSSLASIKIYLCNMMGIGPCPIGYGFPLEFLYPILDFKNLINLLIDIIFWYLLSCLIIWIYDKVKKK